jgi:hypothetical protein
MSAKCDCGHLTETPITIEQPNGKTVRCPACAIPMLEELHNSEVQAFNLTADLGLLKKDLAETEAKLDMVEVQHREYLVNQIDKGEANLRQLKMLLQGKKAE